MGYPKWHPKYKQPYGGKEGNPRISHSSQNWSRNKGARMAANAQEKGILGKGSEITVEKLEQLLKNIPGGHKISVNTTHSKEEVDNNFAGFANMVSCFCANGKRAKWIVDSGATDHMTGSVECVTNLWPMKDEYTINLHNGKTSKISHCGSVTLANG